jgi:large subunit ribosomal protein L18
MITRDRRAARDVRHVRVRRVVRGSSERPRLTVFRSLQHIYAQLVDDESGRTVAAVSSRTPEFRARQASGGNVAGAAVVGELLAAKARARGVARVVFDRGGYQFHGRVKALADAARAGGLGF